MRVKLDFEMDALPKAYRLGLLSTIKEIIRQGSEAYYEQLFERSKSKLKPFAYAPYIHNLELKENQIYGKQLSLIISSPSYEFIMHLINGCNRHNVYSYHGYELELKSKKLLPNSLEFSSIITFKTLSPILIENARKQPLLAQDGSFDTEFNYYAQLLVQELYQRELYKPLQILKTNMKKVVLQEYLHQTQSTPIFMTANQGRIRIEGHPEDLKVLYDLGIGRRRSLGLGLLDIEEVTY